jgi:hypothetical protein
MQFCFSCSLLLFSIFIHSFSYSFNFFLLHFLSVYLIFVSSLLYLLSFQFLINHYFLQYWFLSFIVILVFLWCLFTLFYYVFSSSFILSCRLLVLKFLSHIPHFHFLSSWFCLSLSSLFQSAFSVLTFILLIV